jgi:hypothetical protein
MIFVIVFLLSSFSLMAQKPDKKGNVYVDNSGVMRWENTREEVKGFGINYTVPFAHAYRSAGKLNVDREKAIDDDVYHFARLGFDLYRIHVWDTEISDTLGNLLDNEHLKLFDYLLFKLNERGINYVITPIAFWGNGWPEPDEKTPGFAYKYGKGDCLTNADAIKAQENYLNQFLNHINSYTGVAYKEEPNMIAFEVSNEPHHREEPEKVTAYIQKMVDAMRKTGCKKPIFYNISHSVHLAEAYFNADIQGGTFQWYPTGLGFQKELGGNLLPNASNYEIPFDDVIKKNQGAKLVYEFDGADVGRAYIYPAIARSFREAGIQIATHFAYDPTYLAFANTEYNTHYMNLNYTPSKALALMISGEIFHKIPMNKSYGLYPKNNSFDGFRVSYEEDLAEYVTERKFIYTNTTSTMPANTSRLEQIAGTGNSPLVKYGGNGAYFLDEVDKDVWRLEVMPDAVWVSNPFGRNSLKKVVGIIKWREWPMTLDIPALGENFTVQPLNGGNEYRPEVNGKSFMVKPGTYLVARNGAKMNLTATDSWKNIKLGEFVAPESTVDRTYLLHEPISETASGNEIQISAIAISNQVIKSVQLMVFAGFRPRILEMEETTPYTFTVTIPSDMVKEGYVRYNLVITTGSSSFTYPAGQEGRPFDWDFHDRSTYEVRVVNKSNSINIFNAISDNDYLARRWVRGIQQIPGIEPGVAEYQANIEKLHTPDNENVGAPEIHDYSFRYFFGDKIKGRKDELDSAQKIIFRGRSLNDKPCTIQLALVLRDGSSWGGTIIVEPQRASYELSISDLKPVKTVTLPRPYPTFLPYYFEHEPSRFDISKAESLQFSIGPGIPESDRTVRHGIAIESVWIK